MTEQRELIEIFTQDSWIQKNYVESHRDTCSGVGIFLFRLPRNPEGSLSNIQREKGICLDRMHKAGTYLIL